MPQAACVATFVAGAWALGGSMSGNALRVLSSSSLHRRRFDISSWHWLEAWLDWLESSLISTSTWKKTKPLLDLLEAPSSWHWLEAWLEPCGR